MAFQDSKPGIPSGNIFEFSVDESITKRVVAWPLVLLFLVAAVIDLAIVYLTPVTYRAHSIVAWNEPAAFRSMDDLRSMVASDLVFAELKKLAKDVEPTGTIPVNLQSKLGKRIELKIQPSLDGVAVHFHAKKSDKAVTYANLAGRALVESLNSTHENGWRFEAEAVNFEEQSVFPWMAVLVVDCLLFGLGGFLILRRLGQSQVACSV